MPASSTSGGLGNFNIFEANGAVRHSAQVTPGLVLSWTPQFNFRNWGGPQFVDLPEHVYRFASDIELATPQEQTWGVQLGFTPAIVSDLHAALNRDGFNFDGRGMLFYNVSPALQVVLGAVYLNRVRDQVLPYAGIVWRPSSVWELRLLFPKTRISYFLGKNPWGVDTWIYSAFEYNIEAYQIGLDGPTGDNEKIQIRDYRALLGLRTENSGVSTFVEAGYIFDRDVGFKYGTPGFDITSGFIGRLGLRF
jgi:hypothetical protein